MLLSVAIVNWNTTNLLINLLDSIDRFSPNCDYEIIVIDNASKDFNLDEMTSKYPLINFIANTRNAGYAEGNNQAFEISKGDYVLLLNPDTEVTDGAIDELLSFMDKHPQTAAVGSKLIRPGGSIDRSVRGFPSPAAIGFEMMGLSKLFPDSKLFCAYRMTWFNYNEILEVDQPMGSCLMLSAKVLKEIGSFDEAFPIFFNEVDWLYRAKQAGYKIYFDPNAVVIHHGAASTKQAGEAVMKMESHVSLLRFYEKHYKAIINPIAYWFTIICIRLSIAINCRA